MLNNVSAEEDRLHGQQIHFKLQYTIANTFNTTEILIQPNPRTPQTEFSSLRKKKQ
jgi:hypothetical protein